MILKLIFILSNLLITVLFAYPSPLYSADEVVRPEEIKSKRQVIYDDAAYVKLAEMWKAYYEEYPSEYAYANWMYAARYAADKKYPEMLSQGLSKYAANPILLYLQALEMHGPRGQVMGRKYLERAAALDPSFVDPWFGLVIEYMSDDNEDLLNMSLRRLLEGGIITDEVMDFNYNMLMSLDENAILITNGDNDTYPGWILTKIMKVRPDVVIVNRSLMNTDWYPLYVIEHGLPRFIGKPQLDQLRESILEESRKDKEPLNSGGLFGDTLILRLIQSAQQAGRPVYFAKTLYITEKLKKASEEGRDLGLVNLVTPSQVPYAQQLSSVYNKWLDDFRTSGLESWRLRNAPETDGGRLIVPNYAYSLAGNLDFLKENDPDLYRKMFSWYKKYIEDLLPEEKRFRVAYAWCCRGSNDKEIDSWCKQQGITCR